MDRGFALHAGVAPEVIRAAAREAEAAGFTSFWVNYPAPVDGLAALALAAGETHRIALGVGVVPLPAREPETIAADVRGNALPVARLLLGVGSPNPGALARVRASVAALRTLLPAHLCVAALGPRMCHLAGEVADGVLFNWLTPEYARMSAERVREGAAAARRQPPKLYAYLRVALGPTARDLLEQEANRYAGVPAYAANFTRMGLKPVETAIAAQNRDDVQRGLAPWSGVVDHIIVRSITAKDTVDEHVALVKAAAPA